MRLNIDKDNNATLCDDDGDMPLWESATDPEFEITEETELDEILDYLESEGIIDEKKDVTAIIRETDDPEHYGDNPDTLGDFDDGEDDEEYCEMCGLELEDCDCEENDDE